MEVSALLPIAGFGFFVASLLRVLLKPGREESSPFDLLVPTALIAEIVFDRIALALFAPGTVLAVLSFYLG